MKSDKKILIAFLLNLCFSVSEFIGGAITGSVAILSDAVHDLGDAVSIGASYFLEQKSKREPDEKFTYGYTRYSVLGSLITTLVLLFGSAMVIGHGVHRIFNPVDIHYDGMIVFALAGVAMNLLAAYMTRDGDSLNQKAVNLHMLEDVLGWLAVLVGAIVMRFTDISVLDSLMSIGIALFIMYHALKTFKEVIAIFLKKVPEGISVQEINSCVSRVEGVQDVHHIHIWSMDGLSNCATMHIVAEGDSAAVKQRVREELKKHGIVHATLELEGAEEECGEKHCHIACETAGGHHHHHHHHH